MTITQRSCSDIQHTFGAQADGSWAESYTDQTTGAALFTQPIAPYKPTQTPPARVGLENGWCVNQSTETVETEVASTGVLETQSEQANTSEAGMGSYFLLVVVITGAIAAFQTYKKRIDSEFESEPKYLPNPWENNVILPRQVPHGYGDYIEQEYPPLSEEDASTVTLDQRASEYLRSLRPATRADMPEIPPTSVPTEHQPSTNQGTNLTPTEHQPDSNQIPTEHQPSHQPDSNLTPTFDPREEERPGEFELFQALIKMNDWSPKGKEILKVLWKAQPKTKRYEPALERRNQFANRLGEYSINEQK